jgi:DNA-binding IclR family transcriptional regulator
MIVRGQQSICVVELASPHVLAISRGIGPMGPLGRGASGKAILAHVDDATREAVLKSLPKDIDNKRVRDNLAGIRRDGFRISRGEVIPGATSVAAPFFDHTHAIAGAIAVYAPDARADDDRVAWMTKRVATAAAELSAALGHKSPGKAALESGRAARAR